ncbi:hypothetical protein BDV59DRAFT_206063 [Aspergillus ambiguus]|uniref:uncharacterized protein n=1 Tax=Aspergillus ambiguus TaxID=176160 RepID=UPI003CCD7A6F
MECNNDIFYIFTAVFTATVGELMQAVFVCLVFTFGAAFVISWLVEPHIYYDADEAVTSMPRLTANAASTK